MKQATPSRNFASSTVDDDTVRKSVVLGASAPRIYYAPLSMVRDADMWPTILDACAGMGFDTVLVSAPGDPGPTGNILLPYDWTRPHPALPPGATVEASFASLARQCGDRGLSLMADLSAHRLAVDSPLALELEMSFVESGTRDPRIAPEDRNSMPIRFRR